MKFFKISLFALFLVFALNNAVMAINGPLLDGQGARSLGMGATAIGSVNDSTSIFTNPGAMNEAEDGQLDLLIGLCNPHPSFKNAVQDKDGKRIICPLPAASFISKPFKENFRWGIGMFPTGGLASEYHLKDDIYGQQVYSSDLLFLKVMPGLNYSVNDNLSFGVSMGAAYQALQMAMPYTVHTGAFAGGPIVCDMELDGAGFCWHAGISYKATEKLRIGVTYKAKTDFSLSGDVTLDAGVLAPAFGQSVGTDLTGIYDIDMDYEWPQSLGVGFSYQISPKLLVAAEMEWIDWSNVMNKFSFTVSDGGGNLGAFVPGFSDSMPLNWDDQYVYRFGLEYQLLEKMKLRTGLIYGKSPIPDNTVMPVLCTLTELSGTVGLGYEINKFCSFDFAYEHSFGHEQRTDTSLLEPDYNNSATKLSLDSLFLGLTIKF